METKERRPAEAARVADFVKHLPELTKRRWQQVETQLPKVFEAFDEGELHRSPQLLNRRVHRPAVCSEHSRRDLQSDQERVGSSASGSAEPRRKSLGSSSESPTRRAR